VEYAGNHYCDSHFLELMEKRVRKNLRVNRLIDVNKEYLLIDDGSSEAKITEYFLNKIFKGYLKMKIVKKSLKNEGINISHKSRRASCFVSRYFSEKQKSNKCNK
jgi:hypothetical protein